MPPNKEACSGPVRSKLAPLARARGALVRPAADARCYTDKEAGRGRPMDEQRNAAA